MGVTITLGASIERLAEALADDLRDAQRDEQRRNAVALLRPARVIVPNQNLRKWLQLRIAARSGVAINIEFPFVERGFHDLLAALEGDVAAARVNESRATGEAGSGTANALAAAPARLLDLPTLQLMILAVLLRDDVSDPRLAPIVSYLGARDAANRQSFARRAWQISEQLAGLFLEYQRQRREMIAEWEHGPDSPRRSRAASRVATRDPMEESQRALYRLIFGPDGVNDKLRAASGERRMTLPQYAEAVLSQFTARANCPPGERRRVAIFGFPSFAEFFYEAIFRLGCHCDIDLYQLTFFARAQEESDSLPRMALTATPLQGQRLDDSGTNELLRLWGAPSRENLYLLRKWADAAPPACQVTVRWLSGDRHATQDVSRAGRAGCHTADADPTGASVLALAQRQILANTSEPPPAESRLDQDTSIQIAGCPGIHREVETVYNGILHNLTCDTSLRLTDIAVLVTDIAKYKPVIQSVFDRAPRAIAYNLSDTSAQSDSVYARAVTMLLDLIDSPFSRKEVFDLVQNPCFLAAAALTRQEADQWVAWADNLNIFRAFDQEHKYRDAPNTPALFRNPHYTWWQGLARLRLGRIMSPPSESDVTNPVPVYRDLAPYSDIASADEQSLGAFCLLLEALYRGVEELRMAQLTATEWAARLAALVERFLGVPRDRPAEEQVRRGLLDALGVLPTFDAIGAATGLRGTFDASIVTQFVQANLAGIPSQHGSYLTGGVTVSSLRPMRPIPFPIVYVMGLREGEFPGLPSDSTLDLRRRGRRIGDIDAAEHNRYLFLETMMSTRRRLYLTYVSQDLQKDETYHPCSLINQLRSYLERSVLKEHATPFQSYVMPLTGSSAKYLQGADYAGAPVNPLHFDLLHNYSYADRLLCLVASLARRAFRIQPTQEKQIRERARAVLDGLDLAGHVAPMAPEHAGASRPIDIAELARFLRNPAEAAIRLQLQVYDDGEDEDAAIQDSEPLFSAFLTKHGLLDRLSRQCVGQTVASRSAFTALGAGGARALFDSAYRGLQSLGDAPDGAFGAIDREAAWQDFRGTLFDTGLTRFLELRRAAEFFPIVGISVSNALDRSRPVFPPVNVEVCCGSPGVSGTAQVTLLQGQLANVWRLRDGDRTWCETLQIAPTAKYSGVSQRERATFPFPSPPSYHAIEAYLFYLCALAGERPCPRWGSAREWIGSEPFVVHVLYRNTLHSWTYHATPERARAYLAELTRDYLLPDGFEMLPYESIADRTALKEYDRLTRSHSVDAAAQYAELLSASIEADLENPWGRLRVSGLLSISDIRVPPDAYDKVQKRLLLRDAEFTGLLNAFADEAQDDEG